MRHISLIIITLNILFISCENKNVVNEKQQSDIDSIQALKKFYYPFDELSGDGLVYVFIDDSKKVPVDYWLMKTVKDEAGNRYLIGTSYDAKMEQRYFTREWIVANGMILKDYQFMMTDSVSKKSIVRHADIEENVVFPFNPVKDTSLAYRFHLKFSLFPDTAMNYNLVRDRKFDKYLEYEFEGKKLPAVQFTAKEYVEARDSINGGYWTINSDMTEIYAEGIGLVYAEKKGPGANYRNRLQKRISPEDFMKIVETRNKE